jgi:hypothetical protein
MAVRRVRRERRLVYWENWVTTLKLPRNEPPNMYHTTGLTREQILDLCTAIRSDTIDQKSPWPPILGMYKSVVVALTYMRRNRVQAELAETYGVSQPTISRAITGLTPLIGKALEGYVPTAEDLDRDTQYIVDGTLLPCWSWASSPELYSGKHKTTGMNCRSPELFQDSSGGSRPHQRKPTRHILPERIKRSGFHGPN